MNACPNCGAELKFDIASQMLACPFCGAKIDPASYRDFGAAADEDRVPAAGMPAAEEGIAQDVVDPSRMVYGQVQQSGMGTVPMATPVSGAGAMGVPMATPVAGAAPMAVPMATPIAGAAPMAVPMATPIAGAAPMAVPMATPIAGAAPMAVPMATPIAGAAPMAVPMATPIVGAVPTAAPVAGAMPAGQEPVMSGMVQQPQGAEQYAPGFDPTANMGEMEVIAYSCPQCGGSIYSTDQSVNGFCSFCGSNITLQSRMARMKYPKYVMPFRVNKHACKQYYLNHVKKAFFAPKELKNPEYLERFRGIYMPYWGYDVTINDRVVLDGTISYRRGDYVFTEHYNCSGRVDAFYRGLSYDASSSFDDHFSEQIAPFDAHAMVDFNPAYLSGFYADMQDVSYQVYEEDAIRFGRQQIMEGIRNSASFPGITFADTQEGRIRPKVDKQHEGVYTAFFPVWFLSYRNNDRVAYAVVNGQTGKLISDLPVDKKKFILSALVMAIPIFLLLLQFPVMKPANLVLLAEFFSVMAVLLFLNTIKKVGIRDLRLDDRGYLSKYDRAKYNAARAEVAKKAQKSKEMGAGALVVMIVVVAIWAGGPIIQALAFVVALLYQMGNFGKAFVALIMAIVLVVINAGGTKKVREVAENGAGMLLLGMWLIFAACLYGGVVILADPVSNLPYYIGVVLLFAGTLLAQLMSLEQYNMLTTRPLPQLNRKGGDDSAQD